MNLRRDREFRAYPYSYHSFAYSALDWNTGKIVETGVVQTIEALEMKLRELLGKRDYRIPGEEHGAKRRRVQQENSKGPSE